MVINRLFLLKKSRTNLFVSGLAICLSCLISGPLSAHTLTLDEALKLALENNPQIAGVKNESKAAHARVRQAYSPESPEFEVEAEKTPISSNDVSNAMSINYKIKQTIPSPGKLINEGRAAGNEAKSVKNIENQTVLQILAEVKKTYYDLFLVNKKIQLNLQNKSLFSLYKGVAETKYASNTAPFDDPVKASLEESASGVEIEMLKQEKEELLAQLKYLLGGNLEASVRTEAPAYKEFNHSLIELTERANNKNPFLKARVYDKKSAQNRLSSAKAAYIPDLMAIAAYNQMSNQEDAWTASLGIKIPLWFLSKEQAKISEMKYMSRAASNTAADTENSLTAMVHGTFEKIKNLQRIVSLYKGSILRKARASVKANETAYSSGTTDFLNLVEATQNLNKYEVAYWQSLVNYSKSLADLEVLIGEQLWNKKESFLKFF